jgi:hypothetical protein
VGANILKINRGCIFSLCLIYLNFNFSNCQTIKIISDIDSLPLKNAHIFSNNNLIGVSDIYGQYEFKKKQNNLKISHLGYQDLFLKEVINDTIIIIKFEKINLNEISIEYKKEKKVQSFLNNIIVGETNFTFREHALVLLEVNSERINSLSIEVIDVFGVKNIKFRPFRLNIFEFDTLTNSLGKKVFESEILSKSDNKKYFNYKFREDFKLKGKFFFISFEILDSKYYNPEYIESKHGIISAVPSVKLKPRKIRNSYKAIFDETNSLVNFEEFIYGDFNIKINYEKD